MAEDRGWICVAQLSGAHGVRGEVRVRSFTNDPAALKAFPTLHRGVDGPVIGLTLTKAVKGGFAARMEGVTSREQAQSLSGTKLFVPRDQLPAAVEDDEFYLTDLVGLAAFSPQNQTLGQVRAVVNYGADDLLELSLDEPAKGLGRTVLVPFDRRYVPDILLSEDRVIVDLDAWLAQQAETGETR